MNLDAIQDCLRQEKIDGWLMADFHGRNEIALSILHLSGFITRRWFYFVPADGEPTALIPAIEKARFETLPGAAVIYCGYRRMETELASLLNGKSRIAMEYSEGGRLPYVSLVDAGTIEMVRHLGVEIVSSADLVARFQAVLTPEQIDMHRTAASHLIEIKDAAFARIAQKLQQDEAITEYEVSRFILEQFAARNMETDHPPNCSVGAHAADPHYEPTVDRSATIGRGDLILIDLWAKVSHADGIYADITWMAYAGSRAELPQEFANRFDVIRSARDAAVMFVRENCRRPIHGYEVDDACRDVIINAGYGDGFFHRTGHSLTDDVHGTGPNIDNLETEDHRRLQCGHLFTIEPGIYIGDCGLRTEIDVLMGPDGPEVTTLPLQDEITPLL